MARLPLTSVDYRSYNEIKEGYRELSASSSVESCVFPSCSLLRCDDSNMSAIWRLDASILASRLCSLLAGAFF